MARNNGRDGIPRIGRPDKSAQADGAGDMYDDRSADTGPVDIAAVRRDDEFIEALRGDGPIATEDADEYQLALLLANWRAEISAPAFPAGPNLDEVAASVDEEIAAAGMRRKASTHSRPRLLRPIAGAAAAVAVVMGGLVVFSYNSTPGDPLWSVKSVVFTQQAESTVAQIDTTSKLEQAEQLLASGNVAGAQELLNGASTRTDAVLDQAQRSDLEIWLQRLTEQVQSFVPPPPPAPPTDPQVPLLPPVDSVVPTPPPLSELPLDLPAPTTVTDPLPPSTTVPVSPAPSEVPAPPTTTAAVPPPVSEPIPTSATASGSTSGPAQGSQTQDVAG